MPVAVFGMGPRSDTPDAWQRSRAQLDRALGKHDWLSPAAVTVFGGVDPPGRGNRPQRDLRNWQTIRDWAAQALTAAGAELTARCRPGDRAPTAGLALSLTAGSGPAVMNGSSRGTALVVAVVGVPVLASPRIDQQVHLLVASVCVSALSAFLSILPLASRGRLGRSSTKRGYLCGAIRSLAKAMSSSPVADAPALSTR